MAPKQNDRSDQRDQAIVPMSHAPVDQSTPPTTQVPTTSKGWAKMLDRVLDVQRPAVVAHVAGIRRRKPDATPAEVIQILERHYLTAVTTGGAAVGASAVVPGIGIAASFSLSGVETIGFLEATALFAQSVTEVHGITIDDPERSRTLVMAMILGTPGTQLIKQLAGQASGGQARTAFWGEMVASSLPQQAVTGIAKQVRDSFVKRFIARQGTSVLGRALPFGIGAAVGGLGNHALGRKVIQASRTGFGEPPAHFPVVLEQDSGKPGRSDRPTRRERKLQQQADKQLQQADKQAARDGRRGGRAL